MKNLYKCLSLLLVVMVCSCEEEAIEPLTGKYPAPIEYTLNDVTKQEVQFLPTGTRLFTIELSGDGNSLYLEMVGDQYYLPGQTYTIYVPNDEPEAPKYGSNGTYSQSYFTAADGSSHETPITSGSISVIKEEDNYRFSGALTLENGRIIKIQSTCTLLYEDTELPVTILTKVLSVTNNVPNGTHTITLQLASEGVSTTFDPTTFTTVYSGTGNYLAVDFYSADGTLVPGTYTPADNDSMEAGNYAKGYDPGDIFGMGIPFTNWGTCWWTVTDGVTSAIHVNQGDIVVEKSESVYTITLQNDRINTAFSGEISDL